MKVVERMACPFSRENWPCKVTSKHLDLPAKKEHPETKFVKVHAEKFPYLTEKLQIWMLPTLALVRKEKVIDYICGFDDFGGKDDFKTETLEKRLLEAAMISAPKLYDDSSDEEAYAVKRSIYGGGKRAGPGESDSDGSDSDY